jgi:hypothetical protein
MMQKNSPFLITLVIGLALLGTAQAGELEPPAPPAPSMVTLQQIFERSTVTPVALATTGQVVCTNIAGIVVDCSGTGQDAEFKTGVTISPRYVDNANGTVTDNLTGLIWLKNANCFGQHNWADALTVSNGLKDGDCGLTDGSVAGDWHLPNMKEMMSLVDYGQSDPALSPGHPFTGVQADNYWTSSSRVNSPTDAWNVPFIGYDVHAPTGKLLELSVWPVRN